MMPEYTPYNPTKANREHEELAPPQSGCLRQVYDDKRGATNLFDTDQAKSSRYRGTIRHPALGDQEQTAELALDGRGGGTLYRGLSQQPVVVHHEGGRMLVKEQHMDLVGGVRPDGTFCGELLVRGEDGGSFSLRPEARGVGFVETACDLDRDKGGVREPATSSSAAAPLDEATQNESYFARDLRELAEMHPGGADGFRPRHVFNTGASYLGQWKGNQRHGVGGQVWGDGASFTGQWRSNFSEGLGKFVHADGDVYVGQWQQSTAQGLGTFFHKNALTVYCGQWVEDLQHGDGVEKWEGGSEYDGQFHWGKKQGSGLYKWPDGSWYTGQWHANSISGYGHYVGQDGREFRGMWKEAVIHGCGKYSWPDGRTYCGQYVSDKKHGVGTFTWQDGRHFEGFWHEGKQHGFGTIFKPGGEVLKQGIWVHGKQPEAPEEPFGTESVKVTGSSSLTPTHLASIRESIREANE